MVLIAEFAGRPRAGALAGGSVGDPSIGVEGCAGTDGSGDLGNTYSVFISLSVGAPVPGEGHASHGWTNIDILCGPDKEEGPGWWERSIRSLENFGR